MKDCLPPPQDYSAAPVNVRKLLGRNRFVLPDNRLLIRQLRTEDISLLKRILRRELVPQENIKLENAINALAQVEKSPEVCRILGDFVADETVDLTVRSTAALALGSIPLPEAEHSLLANLYAAAPTLQFNVLKSLGQIGSQESLERLNRLRPGNFEFVKKQHNFARALIAHRHNLPGEYLPFRKGLTRKRTKDTELIELTLHPLAPRQVRHNAARRRGSAYGITLSSRRGFELTAGKARWGLFLNELLDQEGLFSLVRQRKLITGILSRWDDLTDGFSTQYVILTDPKEAATEIMVVRSDGEIVYTGQADVQGGLISFAMSDVKRPGTAPTSVRGTLTERGVEFSLSIPFGKRTGKRTPPTLTVT